jgi:predicted GIY-YIG superfamily endonuclease
MSGGFLYILGSHTGTLYIGLTSKLYRCVMQHKQGTLEVFTAAYGCKRLVYFEGYEGIRTAIARKNNAKAGGPKRSSTSLGRSIRVRRTCTDLGMEDDYSA